MAQGTNKTWVKPLIITIAVIVVITLIGVFTLYGLNLFFKYNQAKIVKAEEEIEETTEEVKTTATVVEEEIEEETLSEETTIKDESPKVFAEGEIAPYYESLNGVPDEDIIGFDVSWDEISCLTFGPGKYLDINFPGGEKRGSVLIMLGPEKEGEDKIHYTVTELIPGAAWRGNSYYDRVITKTDWMAWVNLKVEEMKGAPNATDSFGCNTIDVVVARGEEILFQKTFER